MGFDLSGAFRTAVQSDVGRAALDLAAGRQLGGFGLPQVMATPVAGGSAGSPGSGNNPAAAANPARTAPAGFSLRLWWKPIALGVGGLGLIWYFLRKRR